MPGVLGEARGDPGAQLPQGPVVDVGAVGAGQLVLLAELQAAALGEPLTASILGISVLGERLSVLAIVGLVVLAAGLALLAWGSRSPRDPKPYAVEA